MLYTYRLKRMELQLLPGEQFRKKTVTFFIQFKSFHHQDEMMIRRLNNRLVGWLVSCLIAIRLTIVIKKSNSNERHKIKWILMMAMKNNQLAMITNGYCVCVCVWYIHTRIFAILFYQLSSSSSSLYEKKPK